MVRSADVLRRAGMVPLRPDETVRALLDVRGLGPIAGAIAVAARRNPRAIGVADERGALTFTQLSNRSNALARGWQADGIGAGSTIALLCRDHRWMVDAMGAAAKIGAKLLLMNTGFSKPQLADVVEREGVAAIVHDQEFTDLLSAIDGVPRYVAWVDDAATVNGDAATLEALIVNNSDLPLPAPRSPGGMTLLTSGTTGTPKGAPRQIRSPLVAAQFLDRIPLRAGEATFVAAPLFHATGLSQFILSLGLGCTVVLRRRFDPEETLRGIERHRCTALVLVPTMLQRILDLGPEVLGRYDTSSLRIIFCAGSAISPELGNRAMSAFGDVLYNLYGSTEVAVASVATPEDWRAAPGTVGKAPQGCRVRLYDADGKRITAPNTQGRIFVASTLSFGGYSGGGNKEVVDGML
ncbi:MAG: AMP-binding protein, partial [Sciscionella sp.]|nr:AMP-binding protein [Sciscionella sp.]